MFRNDSAHQLSCGSSRPLRGPHQRSGPHDARQESPVRVHGGLRTLMPLHVDGGRPCAQGKRDRNNGRPADAIRRPEMRGAEHADREVDDRHQDSLAGRWVGIIWC